VNENGDDLVVRLHRETVERHWAQKERQRALVETMFEEALTRQREQEERDQALIEQIHREAWEHYRQNPPPPVEPPRGVHYTELLDAKPGEPLAEEWNTYCREVGRLLTEGQEGRHVLIKGPEIIGIFDTANAAYEAGVKRYFQEPFFVHPIRAEEPYLRIRGINCPWPSSLSR
jgi:hypothetical protein